MPRKVNLPSTLVGSALRSVEGPIHGVTRARLRGAGVDHPFTGVSAVGLDLGSLLDRCRAFEPLLRPDEVFSHTTAAMLWGMPLPPDSRSETIHVASIGGTTRSRTRGAIGHRLSAATAGTLLLGLPVTLPADTWCALAATLSREDLVAAADFLISRRRLKSRRTLPALCTLDALNEAATSRAGGRGTVSMDWAIARARCGVESRPESLLRLVLVAIGYPEPAVALAVPVDGGRSILHPDLAWEQWRLLLEYEGSEHWTDPRRMREDILRRELFEAAGWHVVRVVLEDLFVDPEVFRRRIAQVVAAQRAKLRV